MCKGQRALPSSIRQVILWGYSASFMRGFDVGRGKRIGDSNVPDSAPDVPDNDPDNDPDDVVSLS